MSSLKYEIVPKAPVLKSQINVNRIENPQINPSVNKNFIYNKGRNCIPEDKGRISQ